MNSSVCERFGLPQKGRKKEFDDVNGPFDYLVTPAQAGVHLAEAQE